MPVAPACRPVMVGTPTVSRQVPLPGLAIEKLIMASDLLLHRLRELVQTLCECCDTELPRYPEVRPTSPGFFVDYKPFLREWDHFCAVATDVIRRACDCCENLERHVDAHRLRQARDELNQLLHMMHSFHECKAPWVLL